MKKYISYILIFAILLLTSCRNNTENNSTENNNTSKNEQTSETLPKEETSENTEAAAENSEETVSGITEPHIIPVENETDNIPINALPEKEKTETTQPGSTFTGRKPLPPGNFSDFEPNNSKGLPEKKIAHAYGVAKDGKANSISIDFQKFFDNKAYNALCLDTKTTEKILYLTFDCGYENGYTGKILDTLAQKAVSAAFFCTLPQMKDNPDLIARMINEGHTVGNHSNKHPSFAEISRTRMALELQEFDDYLRANFGYTAPVFRFPKGEYTESALELVQSLGYKSIFWSVAYSDWDLDKQKGKDFAFNTITARLHPGAVILLHSISPDNAAALGDIIDWAINEGYSFKSLL